MVACVAVAALPINDVAVILAPMTLPEKVPAVRISVPGLYLAPPEDRIAAFVLVVVVHRHSLKSKEVVKSVTNTWDAVAALPVNVP